MRDKSWSQPDLEADMAATKLKASSRVGAALEGSPQIEWVPIGTLHPNPRNGRTHSKKQLKQIAASIRQFGFINPLIVDSDSTVLAGNGRFAAARLDGLTRVPILRFDHLSVAQKRA